MLTTNQRRIVHAPTDRCVLVNAGPGTGKTHVLVERVAWLVGEKGFALDQLLVVTFTRKAARELRERLARRLLEGGWIDSALALETAWVTNFHGLCARLLRENALRAAFDPEARIQDEAEAKQLSWGLRRAFMEGELVETALEAEAAGDPVPAAVMERVSWKFDQAVRALGRTREQLTDVGAASRLATETLAELELHEGDTEAERLLEVERRAHSFLMRCLPEIEQRYEAAKGTDSLLDYVDLEVRALEFLRTKAGERLREQFAVVLVDEFQDTNRVQLEILERLSRPALQNLMAVGDERQSIYAFRGARIENIRTLPQYVKGKGGECLELELFENFRSYQEILDVSLGALVAGADDEEGAGASPAPTLGEAAPQTAGAGTSPAPTLGGADPQAGGADPAAVGAGFTPARPYLRESPPRTTLLASALGAAADDAQAAGHVVQVLVCQDKQGEAEQIAEAIAERVGTPRVVVEPDGTRSVRPLRWGDFAILMRSTKSAQAYEDSLLGRGIPYRTFGGGGFYDRREVLDLLAYLRVISNPYDGLALIRILQHPPFGLSDRSLHRLANLEVQASDDPVLETDAHEHTVVPGFRLKPFDAIRRALDEPELAQQLGLEAATLQRLDALWRFVERNLARRDTVPVSRLLLDVLSETGYGRLLLAESADQNELVALRRRKNVERLLRLARRFEERHVYGSLQELTGYLRQAVEEEIREEEEGLEADGRVVNVMSVHQAKGKEWPVVFVAGVTSRSWPMSTIPDDVVFDPANGLFLRRHVLEDDDGYAETELGAIARAEGEALREEEERRVLFVAMTRAKNALFVSGYGRTSPFRDRVGQVLAELGGAKGAGQEPEEAGQGEEEGQEEESEPETEAGIRERVESALERLALDERDEEAESAAEPATREVHLSFSHVDLYATCPRRYQYTHVTPLPRISQARITPERGEEGEPTDLSPTELGTLFHEALERWAHEDAPLGDLVQQAARDRGWHSLSTKDQRLTGLFAERFLASELGQKRPAPDATEVPFTLVFEEGEPEQPELVVTLTGSIDRLDEDPDGRTTITDYKTNRGVEPEKYGLQLSIYRLAVEQAMNREVSTCQAYFVRHPDETGLVPIAPLSAQETRGRVLETAGRIARRDFQIREHPGKTACWRCPFGGRDGACSEKAL